MAENEFMDLATFLNSQLNYSVNAENEVIYKGEIIAKIFSRENFYSNFLEPNGIYWETVISRRILPYEAIFVKDSNTVFIIDKKSQTQSGSTDEKLGACDFKKQQYEKLLQGKYNVKIIYLLGSWFDKKEYNDVLDHIRNSGCDYCSDYNALFQKLELQH